MTMVRARRASRPGERAMPKTPQINIRVPEEHHGLIKAIAARLRIEPGVAPRLAAVLGDDSAAGGDASQDLAGTDAVLARLAALEATADQIAPVLERLESLGATVRTVEATVNLHDTYIRELRQARSAPRTPLRSNGRPPVESGVGAPPPTAARRGKGGNPGAGRERGKTA